jgi:hypothetical protein
MWWLVGGLWVLAGLTYLVIRFKEAGRQVDSIINWTLPPKEDCDE